MLDKQLNIKMEYEVKKYDLNKIPSYKIPFDPEEVVKMATESNPFNTFQDLLTSFKGFFTHMWVQVLINSVQS